MGGAYDLYCSQPPGGISTCYGLTFSNQTSILSSQQRPTSRDQSQPPGQNHQAPAPNLPRLRAPNPRWDPAAPDPSVRQVPQVPPVPSVPPVRGPAAPSWPVEFCCQAFDLLKNLIIRHRESTMKESFLFPDKSAEAPAVSPSTKGPLPAPRLKRAPSEQEREITSSSSAGQDGGCRTWSLVLGEYILTRCLVCFSAT